MHSFKSQLKDNKDEIKATNERMHEIELLVAGKYVTREEIKAHNDVVLAELKTIQTDIRTCMLHNGRKDDLPHDHQG